MCLASLVPGLHLSVDSHLYESCNMQRDAVNHSLVNSAECSLSCLRDAPLDFQGGSRKFE